jgi:hypothetical protein
VTSILGTALHVVLRNALRTAALPVLAIPGGPATFDAPAFRRVWWLALGWSFAEVTAGIAQGYQTLALYRDVLVPENTAREFVTFASPALAAAPPTWSSHKSDSTSPPPAADERLRESLSRGEDGSPGTDVAGSPVRGRWQQQQSSYRSAWTPAPNDADIRLEVDKDFDELVAVKAREELEELYGVPAIVSLGFFISANCLTSIAVRACVRIVFVARRVDIPLSRHPSAPVGGVPHFSPRLTSNNRRPSDVEHSVFMVEQPVLGHVLGRVRYPLVPLVAAHSRVFATRRRARCGVPRAPSRIGDVICGAGSVGCIILIMGTQFG